MSSVEIIFRSFVLFTLLFIYTKLLKKKHLAEFKILDYMTSIVLGGIAAIHTSTVDLSLGNGIVAMTVWFLFTYVFQLLSFHLKAFHKLQGKQTIIIKDGKLLPERMKKERYSANDLFEDLRSKNIFDRSQVEFAVLEPSGRLNVLLKKDHQPLTKHSLKNDRQSRENSQFLLKYHGSHYEPLDHPYLNMHFLLADYFFN